MGQEKQAAAKGQESLRKATDTLSTMLAQEVKDLNARQRAARRENSTDPGIMKGLKEATAVLKDLAGVSKTLNDQGVDAEGRGMRCGAAAAGGGCMTTENKNAGIVWRPQPRQMEFMRRPEPEALYGGAAGGGKSDALVIEALRQVHIPHYRALILRKTYPQLSELIDKTMRYYKPVFPQARYNGTSHCWTFPSGAKIYFGSLHHAQDKYNYQARRLILSAWMS